MEQDTSRASDLPQPLRAVTSHLGRLPGAGQVGRAAGGALDALGAVSPRGRRMAVYAGAGVLGVAGLVEWPVALTGAAVAWLTRPRGTERQWAEAADTATALTDDTSAGEHLPADGDPERELLAGAGDRARQGGGTPATAGARDGGGPGGRGATTAGARSGGALDGPDSAAAGAQDGGTSGTAAGPEGSGSRRGGTPAAAAGDGRGRGADEQGPAGPGDRLIPSRHRQVREQPAKVGDTSTASALRQVAEATTQHAPHGDRDGTSRHTG
ncbi:hypothetical protein LRR80_03174 [Streptomyces sp. RO-S4]|uniref:hypothetical protein n=1 Tax=Streptomyces sp. RO-S4 TaxID=2902486 RepID=UPI00208F03AC|nr:hypothetical protein [Streptomyces sp. RO-S4]